MNDNSTTGQQPDILIFFFKILIVLIMIFISCNAFAASTMTIRTRSIVIVRAANGVLKINTRPIIIQAGKANKNRTTSTTNTSLTIPKSINTRSIVIVHAENGVLKINTKPIVLQARTINTHERAIAPNPPIMISDGMPGSITTKPMFIVHATNGILKINTGAIILQAKNVNIQNRTTASNSSSATSNRVPKSITTRAMVIVRAENSVLKINTKPIIIKAK